MDRGGEKNESVRSLALSELDVARVGILAVGVLRAGIRMHDASDGSSVTYLLAR